MGHHRRYHLPDTRVTLGVMSIRKGHWVMFIIGFFLPFFWLIGALMPSRRLAY